MQETDYRERIPMPGWVVPAAGALGGFWIARRVRGLRGRGFSLFRLFATLNSITTAFAVLGILRRFGYVAVEVTDDAIHLGFGPFEHRLPAAGVRDVRVVSYNPLPFLGWGYRIGIDGRRAFSQIGVRRGVEITVEEKGRTRSYFVSSNEPEALASAIATVAGVGAAL